MGFNLLGFFKKRQKKKEMKDKITEKMDINHFSIFRIDESVLERADRFRNDLEYIPKCIDGKEYSMSTNLLLLHGSQFIDLKDFFTTHILEIYSVLSAMEDVEKKEDPGVFNSYLELLFINIFNFSEYSLQFFNCILDLKLAESRSRCEEMKSQRDYYKKILHKLETEILNAKSDRKYDLKRKVEIANLKNSEIRTLTLGNFKEEVASKYVMDEYLKLLLKKFDCINEFKKIRNSIAHRRSLNFRSNNISSNPYSNIRVVDITTKITYQNLFDEPNDNFLLSDEELSQREVLDLCEQIIENEKSLMDIAYTLLSGKIYPVKSENCGAKYYLSYYRCTECMHVTCYNSLSFRMHCVLTQFPEYLYSIPCYSCFKETTHQKVFFNEITEYFNTYESSKILKQYSNEVALNFQIFLGGLSYYSRFVTLYSRSADLEEYLRKDNYKNLYKE